MKWSVFTVENRLEYWQFNVLNIIFVFLYKHLIRILNLKSESENVTHLNFHRK